MIVLRVLVVLTIVSSCYGKRLEVILNNAFDYVIDRVLQTVNKTNIDQVKISNLNYSFDYPVLFLNVKGELLASDGWFRSLSTIKRTGDVSFKKINKTATIEAHLGLGNLEIGYKNYTTNIIGVSVNGSILTTVKENSISLKVKVYYKKPNCSVDVGVDFDKFEGINVKVTGLSGFNWLFSTIVKTFIYTFDGRIKRNIENKLLNLLKEPIESLKICQYIH